MRTTLCISILSILVLGGACNSSTQSNEPDLKSAVAAMFEQGWNQGQIEVFAESIADTVLFHYADSPGEVTLDEMSQMVLHWRDAFPDLRIDIEELIVENDIAAARLTLSGTHEKLWRGAEPTGQKVTMALMMFFRFEDGKMVELWEVDDQLGFQKQLGIIPSE